MANDHNLQRFLILEDDDALREGLAAALRNDTLLPYTAPDLRTARVLLRERRFDLLIFDYTLPDGCSLDLCREVAADQPVIFLTVRDGELDEVAAFRAGAWDYVKKPFSLTVLQERIQAALRKHNLSDPRKNTDGPVFANAQTALSPVWDSAGAVYRDTRYRFDFGALHFSMVENCAEPVRLSLSPTEIRLLAVFCAHRGQILERGTLVDRVWGCDGDAIDENALSVTVKRLRDKLGADCIGTVYGLGYVWMGDGGKK